MTLGADFPASTWVSTYRPLDLIEAAVTRRMLGGSDGEPLPPIEESLSVPQAIQAMTIGPAYQLREEHRLGSVRPGKRADLVWLERDLFEIPSYEIHATRVLMTMRDGEVIYGEGVDEPVERSAQSRLRSRHSPSTAAR